MEGIVDIEEVFCEQAFDEAPLAVVHAEGDEGKACYPATWEDAASYHGLEDGVVAEGVECKNEAVADASVVCSEQYGHYEQGDERYGHAGGTFFEVFEGADAEVAEEEGEEDVLDGVEEGAGVCYVPRYFGDEREEEEVASVFYSVVGVAVALDKEEGKDGECQSSEQAHEGVGGDGVAAEGEEGCVERGIVPKEQPGSVVDGHEDDGKQFNAAAVEDVPMAGNPLPLVGIGSYFGCDVAKGCFDPG